ncbi:hypothetical protein [Fowlpox virus]|uniref:Uncharacterized protein n=1 Tax=Fowlpox virus TaxID=10261 RepID=A0A891M0F0_FOWPV|nr:hypothetical protein [Fowlpox virus]UNS14170.1 ALPV-006 [Albatrosspox virus]WPD90953.1 hypothetical protein PPV_Vac110-(002-003)n1 [Avipoxvirus sp.]QRM13810.1 hypothetical protein [Fowlpox virus]UNS14518.1 ALPV-354 [Albatrosspox virus]
MKEIGRQKVYARIITNRARRRASKMIKRTRVRKYKIKTNCRFYVIRFLKRRLPQSFSSE